MGASVERHIQFLTALSKKSRKRRDEFRRHIAIFSALLPEEAERLDKSSTVPDEGRLAAVAVAAGCTVEEVGNIMRAYVMMYNEGMREIS